jgi:hypothetical protein
VLPLPKPVHRTKSPSALLVAASEFGSDGFIALLNKLEIKAARITREKGKIEAEAESAQQRLTRFLNERGLKSPADAASLISRLKSPEIELIAEILCQQEFESSHAHMEVTQHVPTIRSLVEIAKNAGELYAEAHARYWEIADLQEQCREALDEMIARAQP